MTSASKTPHYLLIVIILFAFGAMLFSAYKQHAEETEDYTRKVRHIVVNGYQLRLCIYQTQQAFDSYSLGNPLKTKADVTDIYDICWSKFDILLKGETHQVISTIPGIHEKLLKSFDAFQKLEPLLMQLKPGDGSWRVFDQVMEHDIIPVVLEVLSEIRIGTNWKQAYLKRSTLHSRTLVLLSVFGVISIVAILILLLITQVRATKEALIKAEQAKVAKAKFLAIAGHDLRQPLQAVALLLSTLQSQAETADNARLFQGIHHSLDSITELLNGVLDISKLDAEQLTVNNEAIALSPILNKMLDRYVEQANSKGLVLTLDNPEDVYVTSDELLLERIISNLLSNAVHYTHEGEITLSVSHTKHSAWVTIKDTGPGISADDQQVIFDEFVQLDQTRANNTKGLGLGLSIVKRLCEMLGHQLQLDSKPGHGSQFTLGLSLAEAPAKDSLPDSPRAQWSLENLTVLVIEDDRSILDSMALLLESWGCKVLTATTMEQAIAQAKALYARDDFNSNETLLISDYYLSPDYNGCDVITQVQNILGTTPTMLVTGETDSDQLEAIRKMGHSVFRKPLKPAILRVAIQRILRNI